LGEFVFTTRGNIPLAGFSKVRTALHLRMMASAAESSAKPPHSDWVFHDLRRSLVSWLAGNGVAVYVADRLLNHVAGSFAGVLGTYQRYEFIAERRQALAAWGAHIEKLVGGAPTASSHHAQRRLAAWWRSALAEDRRTRYRTTTVPTLSLWCCLRNTAVHPDRGHVCPAAKYGGSWRPTGRCDRNCQNLGQR